MNEIYSYLTDQLPSDLKNEELVEIGILWA